jgi:hypothetical protein
MSTPYDPTGLIAGDLDLKHEPVTIASGENLTRGTLLGRIDAGAASVAAGGGNTGDGVLTMDATNPVQAGAKAGDYTVTCITAATNGGSFQVTDPDGFSLGNVNVGSTFDDDIKFAIADGATDFIVGDVFTVTVAAGSGKYVKSLAASKDGSQTPVAILATNVDASGGDKTAPAYFTGEFGVEMVVFGTGHTAASVNATFRKNRDLIFLRTLGDVA